MRAVRASAERPGLGALALTAPRRRPRERQLRE
jgi:hypothetical protein